jgi:hypothetical protein
MSKAPGHTTVTTEVGYCNFCGRPRTLRREDRHLGELVRSNVTCESCHRTLFSTVGVATAAPAPDEAPAAKAEAPAKASSPAPKPKVAAAKARPAPKRSAKSR